VGMETCVTEGGLIRSRIASSPREADAKADGKRRLCPDEESERLIVAMMARESGSTPQAGGASTADGKGAAAGRCGEGEQEQGGFAETVCSVCDGIADCPMGLGTRCRRRP